MPAMHSTQATTAQRPVRSRRTSRRASIRRSPAEPFAAPRPAPGGAAASGGAAARATPAVLGHSRHDTLPASGSVPLRLVAGRPAAATSAVAGAPSRPRDLITNRLVEAELAGILLSQACRFKASAERAIATAHLS
jgi:hypothetical protein